MPYINKLDVIHKIQALGIMSTSKISNSRMICYYCEKYKPILGLIPSPCRTYCADCYRDGIVEEVEAKQRLWELTGQ